MNSKDKTEITSEAPKVWVGLSECDDERERRTQTAKTLFGQLEIDHALLGSTYDLLREANSCYQNGAFLASTLMCRSAAEAALYICITRAQGNVFSSEWEGMEPSKRPVTKVDMSYIDSKFGGFISRAKHMGLIDTKLEDRLTKGRTWGNLGAHYVSTIDWRIVRSMKPKTEGANSQPALEGLWPTESEAEGVIRESIDIINLLKQSYYSVKPKA